MLLMQTAKPSGVLSSASVASVKDAVKIRLRFTGLHDNDFRWRIYQLLSDVYDCEKIITLPFPAFGDPEFRATQNSAGTLDETEIMLSQLRVLSILRML